MPGAFLYDERVRDALALTALTATAAGMPVANLRDPQPRLRARFTGGAASTLVDFGTATPVEAVALISTNLSANATVRWRLGTLEVPNAAHDSGTVPAHTGDEANGNVVLLRSGAASARYLLVDVADASLSTIDIGILAPGPLWRLARGMAYGVREGRLILDQRDRNPLTGAEFVVPALANPRFAAFTLPALSRAEVAHAHRDLVRRLGAARDAQPRGARTGIAGDLRRRCLDRLSAFQVEARRRAGLLRGVARYAFAAAARAQEALDDPVLERVETDHGDAAARPQDALGRGEPALELAELVVHAKPNGLKGASGRIDTVLRSRDHAPDDLREFQGALDLCLSSRRADGPCNAARMPLFAQCRNRLRELLLGGGVDEVGGCGT